MKTRNSASYSDCFGNTNLVKPVPVLHVDLGTPPNIRWKVVFEQCQNQGLDYEAEVAEIKARMDSMLEFQFVDLRSTTQSVFGLGLRWLIFCFLWVMGSVFFTYWEDLKAIAELLELNPGELLVANLLYEILGGCTSFICTNGSDPLGRPMLARTLDWPFDELAKYTVQLQWKYEGKLIFESVGWLGAVGVLTGCKPGCFGIALNARYPDAEPYRPVAVLVEYIYGSRNTEENRFYSLLWTSAINRAISFVTGSGWSSGSIIRYLLERKDMHFNSAVSFLKQEKLLVPCYFVVCGSNQSEGVVLARDMIPHQSNVSQFNHYLSPTFPFIVQTNSDISELLEVAKGKR